MRRRRTHSNLCANVIWLPSISMTLKSRRPQGRLTGGPNTRAPLARLLHAARLPVSAAPRVLVLVIALSEPQHVKIGIADLEHPHL